MKCRPHNHTLCLLRESNPGRRDSKSEIKKTSALPTEPPRHLVYVILIKIALFLLLVKNSGIDSHMTTSYIIGMDKITIISLEIENVALINV